MDIEDNQRFARGEAIAERVGWLCMALVVFAAALGAFANSPLSHRSTESDNAKVRYQRFGRNQGRTTLEVETDGTAVTDGSVQVWIAQDFLESYDVEGGVSDAV